MTTPVLYRRFKKKTLKVKPPWMNNPACKDLLDAEGLEELFSKKDNEKALKAFNETYANKPLFRSGVDTDVLSRSDTDVHLIIPIEEYSRDLKQGESNQEETLIFDDKNLRSGFAQVPNAVVRDHRLSASAVRLYAILLSYAWQSRRCFPGQDKLAEHMGCNKRTISRTLAELKKRRLISWKRQGLNKVNIYHIRRLSDGYLPKQLIDKGTKI